MSCQIVHSLAAWKSYAAGVPFGSLLDLSGRILNGSVSIATAKFHLMKTADISAVLTGAQLLVSMVEARRAARNGDGAATTAPQELEKIEEQLLHLEAIEGQN